MVDLYDLGERPSLGVVPERRHAFAVPPERFGQPRDAWRREILPTPTIKPNGVLVYVMASGINFNNVGAALGAPVDVIAVRQKQGEAVVEHGDVVFVWSNDEQAAAVVELVPEGEVDPCLSQTYAFDDIPECHQNMLDNRHPYGNMAVLVNATEPGGGA